MYVPATVEQTTSQRIVEAAAVLPEFGGVTGWAGLHWMGGRWFDGLGAGMSRRAVQLVTSCDDIRPQSGIAVSAERLSPSDLVVVDGLRLTSAVRSVCFEMRHAETLRDAVQVLDMAAFSDLVSIAELTAHAALCSGWTGIPQCRSAASLSNENSWSPTEVSTRLVWTLDAGLPPPLVNHPVFDLNGRHVGTPDLLDIDAGVVCEYDGSVHLEGRRRAKDLEREDDYRGHGLEYFTVVGRDLARPERLVQRMHTARGRAGWLRPDQRSWTIETPHWWVETFTVAQRRALDAADRATWLRHRAA